ncbi:MAG: GIY-YIG nuclease family protein [Opitutales bacterium]|nr:GIY-YIG nuclease family protein [Opitutales bacterium]MCH8539314.1 GIY-YIG nuclease family protein [Opitutales bacterium]
MESQRVFLCPINLRIRADHDLPSLHPPESPKGHFYIGHTDDLQRRLSQHNFPEDKSHLGKYTHKNGPWKLVWSQAHPTRSAAVRRERTIIR